MSATCALNPRMGIRPEPKAPTDARILIVDDQDQNIVLLKRILSRWGYDDVLSTTDSREVLGMVSSFEPDLLVLDLEMPTPNGYEVLNALAPANRGPVRLPILVVTADATPQARRRALGCGASDFLSTPLDFGEVRLRMRNLLENRWLQSKLAAQNGILEWRVAELTRDSSAGGSKLLDRLAATVEYRDDDIRPALAHGGPLVRGAIRGPADRR